MQSIRPVGTFGHHNGNGFVRTNDGQAWQYMVLPGQPSVRDANGWDDREAAAKPLKIIMPRLAALAPRIPLANRKALKGFYRQIHILAIATPQRFEPSATLRGGVNDGVRLTLAREYGSQMVHDRFTLIGVLLRTGGGHASTLARIVDMVAQTQGDDGWAPDQSFDHDREVITTILRDAGCTIPSDRQMRRAFAWWNLDRSPDPVPLMVEPAHLHTFPTWRAASIGDKFKKTGVDCATWTRRKDIRGAYTMTIASLGALPYQGEAEWQTGDCDWAARLMASPLGDGMGALALSVRGAVEPGEVSREQLDKDKEKVLDKAIEQAAERHKQNLGVAKELNYANDVYQADGKPWPTLIDAHVHVAIPAVVERSTQVAYPGGLVTLNPDRQEAAFQDMQIGSNVSYNPSPVYWPTPILAYAGLHGRSVAGEDMGLGRASDLPGGLLGFTEADRLPCYVSPFASKYRKTPPCLLVVGDTGAGKTTMMLYLASQWARLEDPDHPGETIPVVFNDPKPNSDDFGPYVRSRGGRVYMLDDPRAEGMLDPVRCMPDGLRDEMITTAVELLSQTTGGDLDDKMRQIALMSIINYGLDQGADCTGMAVRVAHKAHHDGSDRGRVSPLVDDVYDQLEMAADNSQIFRLIYGREPGGLRLNASRGLTLLSAGSLSIAPDEGSESVPSAIQRWAVRMMALGAAGSVMGRNGLFVQDEAHLILGDEFGRSVAQRQGRLARAQNYLPVYMSQKIDEFVNARLVEFIGRGIILPVSAKNEKSGEVSQAQAACRLFDLPDNGRMHARMRHKAVLDDESKAPDWESLYALRDPDDNRLLRGSIPYYVGLAGDAIPVECRIPDDQLRSITGGK